MDQPLVIQLHPNAAVHERQDGAWFQSDSLVVFQHADISTMSELEAVFLYNLGGGFTEIRKVGYRYLQRQCNGRFVHLLAAGCGDTVRITEPPAPETEAAMDNSDEDDSDYATSTASSSDAQEGGEGGAKTRSASVPIISFRHRLQFKGWRTCHAFFSSLI
ncbi:hypothetical protein PIB30_084459 [Stylosanthes scabra]|uniref:Uncharacterized protein n=1 Tax=Stylosanthes scabra TaxID=79078 RepID=A0ABU6URE4_9FABA|nr:hypothetical protein [Stylosanthes scabra]